MQYIDFHQNNFETETKFAGRDEEVMRPRNLLNKPINAKDCKNMQEIEIYI